MSMSSYSCPSSLNSADVTPCSSCLIRELNFFEECVIHVSDPGAVVTTYNLRWEPRCPVVICGKDSICIYNHATVTLVSCAFDC